MNDLPISVTAKQAPHSSRSTTKLSFVDALSSLIDLLCSDTGRACSQFTRQLPFIDALAKIDLLVSARSSLLKVGSSTALLRHLFPLPTRRVSGTASMLTVVRASTAFHLRLS